MILHRTRGQGLNGPDPIKLESCIAYLRFWPQLDELKFVETMLVSDQVLRNLIGTQNDKDNPKD